MNHLKFRRQYLLCNKVVQPDNFWRKEKLILRDQDFNLYLHPDLEFHRIENGVSGTILLGYVIDPYHPENTTAEIMAELANLTDYAKLLRRTDTLSGRFALIRYDGQSIKLSHDATGLREIYHYQHDGIIACGATSKIIADYFHVPPEDDPDLTAFHKSDVFNRVGRRWIGNRTVYKNIFHLPPNHYLDLLPGKIHRFWPAEDRKEKNIPDAAGLVARILTGTFDAAVRRHTLQQGLTGGWDTRLLLAASRNFQERMNYFFYQPVKEQTHADYNPDYAIARKIAEKGRIPLEIIRLDPESTDHEFRNIYYQNNILARPSLLPVYYYNQRMKRTGLLNVSGSGSNEILRLLSSIHRNTKNCRVLAHDLGYEAYRYATITIREWLNENDYLRRTKYKLVDLFNWEQHFGNWGSLSSSEQDIVMEELRPFNNRELIATYLSVKDKYRYKDYPQVHVEVIRLLWPDLLDYNVYTKWSGLKKIMRGLGIEQTADRLFQHVKSLKLVIS